MSVHDPLAGYREGLQPWLVPYVEYALNWYTYLTHQEVTVTSTYRSVQEQQVLYDNRATNPYPVNRPGDSAHQYGLAFDSSVPNDKLGLWTQIRTAVGFRVPANDHVHAEVPSWRQIVRAAGYPVAQS